MAYTGVSIIDYLTSTGQASSFSSRKALATTRGIANYTGTAAQNTQLLNMLRSGAPTSSTPTTTTTPKTTTTSTPPPPTPPPNQTGTGTGTGTGVGATFSPVTTETGAGGTIGGLSSGFNFGSGESTSYMQGILNHIKSGSILNDLYQGQTNAQVKNMQVRLAAMGLQVPTTGTFDQNTVDILKQFQRSQGLGESGYLDQNTKYTLENAYQKSLNKIREQANIFGQQKDWAPEIPGIQASEEAANAARFGGNVQNQFGPTTDNVTPGVPQTQLGPTPSGTPGTLPVGPGGPPGAPGAPTTQGTQPPAQPLGQQLNITRNLTKGSSGADVKALQNFLINKGFSISSATGFYGNETQAAVKKWQESVNLQAPVADYGNFGPISRAFTGAPPTTPPPPAVPPAPEVTPEVTPEEPLTPAEDEYSKYLQGKTYNDYIKSFSEQIGLNNFRSRLDDAQKSMKDLQDKKLEEIKNNDDNPWISEELRLKKNANTEVKYVGKQKNALDLVQLAEKDYDDAREEAKFSAKLAIEQQDKDRDFYFKAKEASLREKERQQSLQLKKSQTEKLSTQVTEVGGHKLLINSQTGATIKDLGISKVPKLPSGSPISNSDIATGQQALNKAKGPDGYTDPALYKNMYDHWVNKGGTPQAFIKAYPPIAYINPKPQAVPLPAILRTGLPSLKTSTGRTL